MYKITLRQIPIVLIDLVLAAASFCIALLLRYDFQIDNIDPVELGHLPEGLLIVIIARGAVFYVFGLYRGVGKYAGMGEYLLIIRCVIIGSMFYIFLLWSFVIRFPRGALIIDAILLVVFLSGAHFSQRILRDIFRRRPANSTRVLIYGAGDAGDMVVREIRKNKRLPYLVCGFIDDDPKKLNLRINGVPVLGDRNILADIVKREHIGEMIIAIPSASGSEMREIFDAASLPGVKVSTVPDLREILEKRYPVSRIRDVRLEDLIQRKPVEIASTNAQSYLREKTILITGAAGSIGQELSRQIADFHPVRLLMLDRDETNMFYLEQNLRNHSNNSTFHYVLLDIGNRNKMEKLFVEYRPEVVFHSAAYKHVPVMEEHPAEAVENNVRNTIFIAQLSEKYGVEKFVNVSTDKAVYPANVMGATKRIAELVLLHYFRNSKTHFMTVRFGNVIGSRGSVVTIFQEQIKNGGPLTVTDPDMERYFMTIPEAVSLINQACALGEGGEIFILNMGKPIRITDLAHDLIKLSGLDEDKDVEIVYTGMRPGEKKKEELWLSEENPQPTVHNKILRAELTTHYRTSEFEKMITVLLENSASGDRKAVIKTIRAILPEFQSTPIVAGKTVLP
ncbi:hypothetical protein AMJ80_00845 [bacterium SM23_31]|nr:MAG: hypothetical protein AMJ80_00845 [bacterium SM23_31]